MSDLPAARLSASDIFTRVEDDARVELHRSFRQLAFSGLGAGLAMGISGLGVALVQASLGTSGTAELIAWLMYPLGFIVVILGRQQLFTENTLSPVTVVLRERSHVGATARLWAIVLAANLLGAAVFAALVSWTSALDPAVLDRLAQIGADAALRPPGTTFWAAVVAGWIIALVAWLVSASSGTAGQVLVIFVLTFAVGAGHFDHSIAGAGETFAAFLTGAAPLSAVATWLVMAVLGNTVGGVVMVALFNYGQVARDESGHGDSREG